MRLAVLFIAIFACAFAFYRHQKILTKDTELMRGFFTEKTWIFFRRAIQKKQMQKKLMTCVVITIICTFSFIRRLYWFWSNDEEYSVRLIDIIFWPCVFLFFWISYFAFMLRNTDKIIVTFRPNNPSAEFLNEYYLINDSFLNCKLKAAVSGFVSKINEFGKVGQQKQILVAINNLFIFYFNLEKMIDKNKNISFDEKKYNFANQTSQISFEEMLTIFNEYFNSLNLEIKIIRSSKSVRI